MKAYRISPGQVYFLSRITVIDSISRDGDKAKGGIGLTQQNPKYIGPILAAGRN